MAPDLCNSGILRGKTRAEVHELLGPPDEEVGASIQYFLRMPYGLSGSDWLEWVRIDFDPASGRVDKAEMGD
jgi:hypothetical protein